MADTHPAPTARHTIVLVRPFPASEPGALPGNEALCTCGHAIRTSLSDREALRQGHAHAEYMNRKH